MARKPACIPDAILAQAADMLRAVAHPLRLRIIELLADRRPRCVGQIQESIDCRQSVASTQLTLLRSRGILAARRAGMKVFYSLANPAVCQVLGCIRRHEKCFRPAGQ